MQQVEETSAVRREPLQWLEFDAGSTTDHPGLMAQIYRREVDGITVGGLFSEDECRHAVEVLAQRRDQHPSEAMFGTMLGMPIAELARVAPGVDDRGLYLDIAERSRAFHVEAFGRDPFDRVREVLAPMADGLAIDTPAEGGRQYASGNVRWMEPGGGGLPAHVGNEFQLHGDLTTSFLRSTTDTRDHYSWFVVLQAPSEGGALSVFDLLFEAETDHLEPWGDQGREDSFFDELPCRKVAPPAGSLVFFGGGWRWHRVDRIAGDRARVTYGGFAARSVDGSAVNFWF